MKPRPVEVVETVEFRTVMTLLRERRGHQEIADALMLTPDLAVNVLALANSETYSGETPITTLERAVVLLGHEALSDLARNCPRHSLQSEHEERAWNAFIGHSAAVAVGAGMMARAAQLALVGEARSCGAIHDLGMQWLYRRDNASYDRALEAAIATESRVVDHERLHCGTDHCELAEERFRELGIPETLCQATGYHHDPLSALADYRYLSILLFAGECLARRAGFLEFCGADGEALEPRVLSALRVGEQIVEAHIPLFVAEMARLGVAQTPCLINTGGSL